MKVGSGAAAMPALASAVGSQANALMPVARRAKAPAARPCLVGVIVAAAKAANNATPASAFIKSSASKGVTCVFQ